MPNGPKRAGSATEVYWEVQAQARQQAQEGQEAREQRQEEEGAADERLAPALL
jgi:hypothetical protein